MKSRRFWFLALALLPAGLGQPQPAPAAPPAPTPAQPTYKRSDFSDWMLSLRPKSFQQDPVFDMTVVTDMTEAGKKLPPVSPESPAYYVTYCGGFQQFGDAPHEQTLGAGDMERILDQALAVSGYLRAGPPAQPPSLLIIYVWGSHNFIDHTDYSLMGPGSNPNSPIAKARNRLDRAALVGGEKFAGQMSERLEQSHYWATAGLPAWARAFSDPVHLLSLRSPKYEFLVDQSARELYYVVASAYDYGLAAKSERKLLWRTRMTVNSSGVSQEQTLPTLIANAGPFFGKAMAEPEILSKRVREGVVTIGPLKVVDASAAPKPSNRASVTSVRSLLDVVDDNAGPQPDGAAKPKAP